MNIQTTELRSITVIPKKDGTCQLHDPTFGRVYSLPLTPEYLTEAAQYLNTAGIKIEFTSSGPDYSYIFLTTDFKTEIA